MLNLETHEVKILKREPSIMDRMSRWSGDGPFNAVGGPKFWLKEIGLFKARKKGKRR